MRVACAGAVVRREGRVLLVRRGTEPGRGLWSIPGGRVEPGESPRTAAVREVLEETGVAVVLRGLAGRVERPGPGGVAFVIDDYWAEPSPGADTSPVAGDDAAEARWCTPEEVAALPCVEGLVEALTGWGALG